jgi:FixJ family two-component response regulator
MKHGAMDYLTKPADVDLLLGAVKRAFEQSHGARMARAQSDSFAKHLASLTAREREVLQHLTAGKLNKQIAAGVEKTTKVHCVRVLQKIGVRSVAEPVRLTEFVGIDPVSR